MTKGLVFLCLIFRGAFHTAEGHTSFNVSQAPEEVAVSRGGNVTFYCIFPILQDQFSVRVLWWKNGDNEYLDRYADKRRRFGMTNKASRIFQLLGVKLQDSGIYHCSVIHLGVVRGNGTGSHLIVHDNVQKPLDYWIPVCAVVRFAFLLFTSAIGRRYRVQNNEDKEEHSIGGNRREDLGAESDFVHYATLDFNKAPRGNREKTQQRIAGVDLMYASVALPDSGKGKINERSTEYAELQTKKQSGVKEAVYTETKIN